MVQSLPDLAVVASWLILRQRLLLDLDPVQLQMQCIHLPKASICILSNSYIFTTIFLLRRYDHREHDP